jgi:hypothetical protein
MNNSAVNLFGFDSMQHKRSKSVTADQIFRKSSKIPLLFSQITSHFPGKLVSSYFLDISLWTVSTNYTNNINHIQEQKRKHIYNIT